MEKDNNSTRLESNSIQEPELVRIIGGKFLMGSPTNEKYHHADEQQHELFVDDFAIGQYPVTFNEYDRYCEETGRKKPGDENWGRENRPVINVSWEDAYNYAQWIAKVTGKPYRLPTETEWEYAARGGTKTTYWWGEKFEQHRVNCAGSYKKTTPVDSFKPNPFEVYDMLGNVWEWTGSLYNDKYDGSEKKCADKGDTSQRVIRGGSWLDRPWYARSAFRNWSNPDDWTSLLGFRLAQD